MTGSNAMTVSPAVFGRPAAATTIGATSYIELWINNVKAPTGVVGRRRHIWPDTLGCNP